MIYSTDLGSWCSHKFCIDICKFIISNDYVSSAPEASDVDGRSEFIDFVLHVYTKAFRIIIQLMCCILRDSRN